MKFDAIKHNFKWNTRAGTIIRKIVEWSGVKLLRLGRRFLRWSLGRCSWCGTNCGFSSTVSRKGLRCSSLRRDCTNEPY